MADKALTLFKPGGRQHLLEGRYVVQATPVTLEHTEACVRQAVVHARLPGDSRESWGMDIPLPAHIKLTTVEQLDAAVTGFFNRWPDPLKPCPVCSQMTWNRAHFPSEYRDDRCGDCWFKDFDEKCAKWAVEAQDALDLQDIAQYHKGMRWRVSCIVHPGGGDDFIVDIYSPAKITETEGVERARQKHPRAVRIDPTQLVQLKDH